MKKKHKKGLFNWLTKNILTDWLIDYEGVRPNTDKKKSHTVSFMKQELKSIQTKGEFKWITEQPCLFYRSCSYVPHRVHVPQRDQTWRYHQGPLVATVALEPSQDSPTGTKTVRTRAPPCGGHFGSFNGFNYIMLSYALRQFDLY